MKSALPHLIYLSLFLGCALFFRQALRKESQILDFLMRPADEMCEVLQKENSRTKKNIEKQVRAYINPVGIDMEQRMHQADSLMKIPLNQDFTMMDLSNKFAAMMEWDPTRMSLLTPHHVQSGIHFWPAGRSCLIQIDSLRKQLAFSWLLDYMEGKVSGTECFKPDFELKVSNTILCPPPGQSAQIDFVLAYRNDLFEPDQISINGQPLIIDDDLAHFEHTFTAPGIYPLNVEARASGYGVPKDSMLRTAKTFYLHVTR